MPRASNYSFTPKEASASLEFLRDVTPSMVSRVVTKNFDEIDTNKNGLLSQRELAAYEPKPGEKLVFDYSISQFDELKKIHNGTLFGDEQISKTDLIQYEIQKDLNLPAVQARFHKYGDQLQENFKVIDTNKDEKLTVKELDTAFDNPQLDVGARQMVRFFRDNYDAVTGAIKPAFLGPMQLEKATVGLTRDMFDFNSNFSKSNGVEYAGMGALMGGIGGGLVALTRFSGLLSMLPAWPVIAAGAAVGGLLFGGYMYISGRDANKSIPVSREKIWHAISAELAQESAANQAQPMLTEQHQNQPLSQTESKFKDQKSKTRALLEDL